MSFRERRFTIRNVLSFLLDYIENMNDASSSSIDPEYNPIVRYPTSTERGSEVRQVSVIANRRIRYSTDENFHLIIGAHRQSTHQRISADRPPRCEIVGHILLTGTTRATHPWAVSRSLGNRSPSRLATTQVCLLHL